MNIKEKENELFERWSMRHDYFVGDGIANEEAYLNSKIRLLYILKEVNDLEGGGWDLRDFMVDGGRPQTWDNITRWTYGIRNIGREVAWQEIERITPEQRVNELKSIAAMNMKKVPGSYVSDVKGLWGVANEDQDLLREQFSLYNPNIIICCGTWDIANQYIFEHKLNTYKMTSRGVYYCKTKNDQIVIDYAHPQARCKNQFLFYSLHDAIKEILKS